MSTTRTPTARTSAGIGITVCPVSAGEKAKTRHARCLTAAQCASNHTKRATITRRWAGRASWLLTRPSAPLRTVPPRPVHCREADVSFTTPSTSRGAAASAPITLRRHHLLVVQPRHQSPLASAVTSPLAPELHMSGVPRPPYTLSPLALFSDRTPPTWLLRRHQPPLFMALSTELQAA